MKKQTLLAILQQSEYNWPYFYDWYQAHRDQLPQVKPPQPTLKLKLISFFSQVLIFLPVLTRLRVALSITQVIEAPYKWLLLKLAKKKLLRLKNEGLTVVAIAGSYGKTSTKLIAAQLLKNQLKLVKTEKSFNTLLGISQTIRQKLNDATQLFIVELGEYYQGDIDQLCQFVQPDLGIMTPLGAQHLERMGQMETIAQTIAELGDYLIKKNRPVLIHQSYRKYLGNSEKLISQAQFYGTAETAEAAEKNDYVLLKSQVSRAGTEYQLRCQKTELDGFTPLLGEHQAVNLLPSFWLAQHLNLSLEGINQAAAGLNYIQRRHQPKQLENNVLLLDNSYNTNPQSIKASLKLVKDLAATNKIIITMGFIELGEDSDRWHYWLGRELAATADYVGLINSRWNQTVVKGFLDAGGEKSQLITASSPAEALAQLRDKIIKNSLILIEGGYQEIFA